MRRSVQISFVLLFILLPVSNLLGQIIVLGTLASLDLGPLSLVDPAVGIASGLASGAFSWSLLGGMILPVGLALALGPVFCSWICPWGLISEQIEGLRRRIWKGRARPRPVLRVTILSVLLLGSALTAVPLVSLISAPRLITTLPIELILLGGAAATTTASLLVLLGLELALPHRLWCRAVCPVGTLLGLLRSPWTLKVQWRSGSCLGRPCSGRCESACTWAIDPKHHGSLAGCTSCGACIEACPSLAGLEPGEKASPALRFTFSPRGPSCRDTSSSLSDPCRNTKSAGN